VSLLQGIVGSIIAAAIVALLVGGYKRWFGQQIRITQPKENDFLLPAELHLGVQAHPVYGTVRHVPKGHKIWLLAAEESTGKAWPQGFSPVEQSGDGTWKGYIHVWGWHRVTIVAVIAPPTSQEYFRYFQRVGKKTDYEPIIGIPPECKKRHTISAKVPPPTKGETAIQPIKPPLTEAATETAPLLRRPHLSCVGFDSFGMYSFLPDIIGVGLKVVNDERRFSSTAHNLRVSIRFRHALGDEFIVNPAFWYDGEGKLEDHVSLAMQDQRTLMLCVLNSQTSPADYRVLNSYPLDPNAPRLEYGDWNVDIAVKGDNVSSEFRGTLAIPRTSGLGWTPA
jgi:hypothetical protein